MKNKPALSQRERSAICAAAIDLELLCARLLSHLREPKVTKIRRATERTSLAIELAATVGYRRDSNLRRIVADMATTLLLVRTLHLEGKIGSRVCDYLRRRIDQIVSGVEQMSTTRPDEWSALALPVLEPEVADPEQNPERLLAQAILQRIDEIARSLLTEERPAAEPSESVEPI